MKQQALLGFLFALLASAMWASIPIALQQLLTTMNAETIVWFRFFIAALGLFIILSFNKKLPKLTALCLKDWFFIGLGVIGLSANFFLYNVALQYIPPTTSQVFSPFSSFGMLIAGVLLFNEPFSRHQKIGVLLLILGLILFFNDRLEDFLNFTTYFQGILICFSASVIWVAYGIAQKFLLHRLTAQQILLPIYLGCSMVFLPVTAPDQVLELNWVQIACLVFCCLNTLIAYGSYAEALNRWEVTKVSAILTQIPILTLVFSEILIWFWPDNFADYALNWISYIGAIMVVSGALISVIGQRLFSQRNT